jgi:hypothetical protein
MNYYDELGCMFLKDLWRRSVGKYEKVNLDIPDYKHLANSERSDNFVRLMNNRLVMGGIRYGLLNSKGKFVYDRINGAIARLEHYKITGCLEDLVDAANGCLLEFEEGQHPNKHWNSSDDGEHF